GCLRSDQSPLELLRGTGRGASRPAQLDAGQLPQRRVRSALPSRGRPVLQRAGGLDGRDGGPATGAAGPGQLTGTGRRRARGGRIRAPRDPARGVSPKRRSGGGRRSMAMESRAQQLAVYGNFIGGRWQEPASGEFAESRDPATGEIIARIPRSSRQDVEAAVAAARKAFDESPWKDTPLLRSRVLARMADCLERHGERLCRLDTRETGKPLEQSRG